MGKHKKKKHLKQIEDAVPDDVLDAAVVSIKKFRKITNEIAKLSTGQKLLGGVVLAAAGLIYLDQRKGSADDSRSTPRFDWARLTDPKEKETSATEEAAPVPVKAAAAPDKARKSPKAAKAHSLDSKKPAAPIPKL